jgi:hypothetical protein
MAAEVTTGEVELPAPQPATASMTTAATMILISGKMTGSGPASDYCRRHE